MYFVPANAIDQIRAATFRGPFKTLKNSVFMCSLASKVSDGLLEIKLLFISKMYFFVSKRIPLFSFFYKSVTSKKLSLQVLVCQSGY